MSQDTSDRDIAERIYPAPPPPKTEAELSLDVWGYTDSGFEISRDGEVTFKGDRYPISGTILPDLLPWAGEILASVDLPARALSTPMTYSLDGRQYIALTIAGAVPELIALALPNE